MYFDYIFVNIMVIIILANMPQRSSAMGPGFQFRCLCLQSRLKINK